MNSRLHGGAFTFDPPIIGSTDLNAYNSNVFRIFSISSLRNPRSLHFRFVLRVSILTPQDSIIELNVFVDSDWAGCSRTRRSTSGFVIDLIGCATHFGSKTQAVPALSSGEAEYYGLVKGSAQALGMQSMFRDLGIKLRILIKPDASAAKGQTQPILVHSKSDNKSKPNKNTAA